MGVRKLLYSIGLVATFITTGFAQTDTLRLLQYNLLNYGDNVNPSFYKDIRLNTIIQYVQPDVFSANEIYQNASLQNNILTSVLDTNWQKGTYVNTNNQVQTNMLFWRKDKLALISQTTVSHLLRDIIAFKFYYRGVAMSTTDTVFLTVIVAHLKASSDTNSAKLRKQEVETVTNYVSSLNKGGNYIFVGDFNIYENTEEAYKGMSNHINTHARFYDPVNRAGIWHNNNAFADLHTQSTRSTNLTDGGVSGGMDDRFDFILTSDHILNDSSGIKYISGSYKTLGQDGKHFNKSINDIPTNTSAPVNVIQALYEMSDHLPVYADFVVKPKNGLRIATANWQNKQLVKVVNPFDNMIRIFWDESLVGNKVTVSLCAIDGSMILHDNHEIKSTSENIVIEGNMPEGLYFLQVKTGKDRLIKKLIKR
ncbi:MAG: T9SS type A sorting domain-containing protein [Flavipsychrobacter sp.]